jgi:hypothetical protein
MLYLIYAEGQFDECNIVITEYDGDGSSIGKDSIIPVTKEEKTEDKITE